MVALHKCQFYFWEWGILTFYIITCLDYNIFSYLVSKQNRGEGKEGGREEGRGEGKGGEDRRGEGKGEKGEGEGREKRETEKYLHK